MKNNFVKSRIIVALFTMLAPEYLVLNAVSEFITARESIRKHTKPDKDGLLSTLWFLSKHGWHLFLSSEQRIPSNMQHVDCLAVTPISKKVSVGLSTGQAEILGNLVSPVAEHTIGLRAEYGHPASFSNSES